MDIDALAKKFAKYEPMLQDMYANYEEWKAARSGKPTIDPDLHAAIHAPLHESDDALAARAEQATANDDQSGAEQAELDEANANLQKEADAKAEADRLQAEIDRKAAETAKTAAAAGQNQGQDAGNAAEGGKAPENAGEASPGAPLAEQTARDGANQHGLGPDTDGGPNPDYVAPGAEGQPKVPEEQPKG